MNRKTKIILCVTAAAVLLLGAVVWAADAEPGSEGDPLISLSYLEQDFTTYMKELFRTETESTAGELKAELDEKIGLLEEQQMDVLQKAESMSFRCVELPAGSSLTLKQGAELILRSGSVQGSEKLQLLDEVNGGGTLGQNRLYVVLEGGSLTARSSSVLLVRDSAE